MYLDHFGLREFPFRSVPDPALLFWSDDHRRAFDLLTRAVRGDRPVTAILGAPGTGKTTLLQHFVASLPKDICVGTISTYSSGLDGLGHWLHWAFNLHVAGPESELRAAFEAYLVAQHRKGIRCLLIVDEAQNLSHDDIAALISLTRLPALTCVSLRLVLAGQLRLRRHLPTPRNREGVDAFAPVQIGAMSSEDVSCYIHHRIAMSGGLNPVFDDEAVQRIASLTAGVPRLVNGLCELLLTSAFGLGQKKIDSAFVDLVLKDIRQTGILDHLLNRPARPSFGAATTPMPVRAPLSTPLASRMPAAVGPTSPPAQGAEPTAFPLPAGTATRPAPANMPALPSALHDSAATPVKAGHSHKRTIGLSAIAAGTAAAVALAALSTQLIAPPLTVAALQQDGAPGTQPATVNTSTPFHVGPTLAAPATLQEPNANALYDQALIIGAQDPLAAAIGFARAALRGDARSAFYLGQHFEAGDGVPRNAALAAAWYASASKTQRGARQALEDLTETPEANVQSPTAPPRPLVGMAGADGLWEFVWTAPDGAGARYLIELAEAPDARPQQYGPFDLSAALLNPSAPARLWRVVSLGPDGARMGASDWHPIETNEVASIGAAPL